MLFEQLLLSEGGIVSFHLVGVVAAADEEDAHRRDQGPDKAGWAIAVRVVGVGGSLRPCDAQGQQGKAMSAEPGAMIQA